MREQYWLDPQQYTFTAVLDSVQWAWEFLRRNPEYRRDWLWFSTTWAVLEARYGKPPERDFASWQRDPDAYRLVDDSAGDCRADQDRLLIECWMGEKWGFYKFPLDPATDRPQPGLQLQWRDVEQRISVIEDADSPYLREPERRIALGFDLDLPLREQLERAKRLLQARQGRLRRSGAITMRTISNSVPVWTLMLRLLDGINAGVDPEEVIESLREQQRPHLALDEMTTIYEQAQALVNGGYRSLPYLPD